tara:strand:- start:501 stop:1124 length:624 start_codon:yes stop_codon:yes gene_type:complete
MKKEVALKQLAALKKYSGKKGKEMRLAAEGWGKPWKVVISTIMSAQTMDEVTIPVSRDLFREFSTLKKLSEATPAKVARVIRRVNYYKTKSRNIVACAKVLFVKHRGKIPADIDELVKLPGVGRKTANIFVSEMGLPGIAVDTHVSYISQKLAWTKHKMPDAIEKDLKALFPEKKWSRVNPTVVRFGKTYTKKTEKDALLRKVKKVK